MAFIRKSGDGNYYICFKKGRIGRTWKRKRYKKIFIVKSCGEKGYINSTKTITFPKELIGKRVKLKVEIIED